MKKENNIYAVASHESWEIIEFDLTYEEALDIATKFEAEDKANGTYTPGFYDIVKKGKDVKWELVEQFNF